MPLVCINRPNRKFKRRFTARDAGRVVAYARAAGASDFELLAHIAQAFGVRKTLCNTALILDFLNNTFFVGAVITLMKAIVLISKGLRLLATGKASKFTASVLEFLVPKKWVRDLGVFFLWTGMIEAGASATIVFLTSILNNLSLYVLIGTACDIDSPPYPVQVRKLDLGDLDESLERAVSDLKVMKEMADKTR